MSVPGDAPVAVVTGGARRLGRHLCSTLAARGFDLVVLYRTAEADAQSLTAAIEARGRHARALPVDVAFEADVASVFRDIRATEGRLDLLVNNVGNYGGHTVTPVVEQELDFWRDAVALNLHTTFLGSRAAARHMIEAGEGGSIVNITSQGSQRVLPYYFSVGTSKAALEAVTRYLAVEFAPKGISVNAVSGGYVETGALDHFPNRDQMLADGEKTLTGRPVSAQDIAQVVLFLCSDAAAMIRGQVLVVDGGVSLKA